MTARHFWIKLEPHGDDFRATMREITTEGGVMIPISELAEGIGATAPGAVVSAVVAFDLPVVPKFRNDRR